MDQHIIAFDYLVAAHCSSAHWAPIARAKPFLQTANAKAVSAWSEGSPASGTTLKANLARHVFPSVLSDPRELLPSLALDDFTPGTVELLHVSSSLSTGAALIPDPSERGALLDPWRASYCRSRTAVGGTYCLLRKEEMERRS
jgi:hypothetical protein